MCLESGALSTSANSHYENSTTKTEQRTPKNQHELNMRTYDVHGKKSAAIRVSKRTEPLTCVQAKQKK